MSFQFYAMDTSFYHSLGAYTFEARCEILAELGYDATYLTLWDGPPWEDVAKFPSVRERYGLDIAGTYVTLDITGDEKHAGNQKIIRLLETVEACPHIEVSVIAGNQTLAHSDPAGDEQAEVWLHRLLAIAEKRGLTLSLYPHINFWLERVDDALRLCRRLNHPHLRVVFCGFHWYAKDGDGKRLPTLIEEVTPYLRAVNVCGSRYRMVDGKRQATIEPLDEGELDNFALLGMLKAAGYRGPVGVQGYSVGGDAYIKLKRSLAVLRDITRRLELHPEWASLRPPQ